MLSTFAKRGSVVVVAALMLAGCSNSGPTPTPSGSEIRDLSAQQILDLAKSNATAQTSVHSKGKGNCPSGAFITDMKLRNDGNGYGVVTLGGTKFDVVSSPDAIYINAAREYWAGAYSSAIADKIGTKWVKVAPASNSCLAALGSFSNLLANYLGYPGTPKKENGDAVFGVPAQLISIPPDVAIWVRTTGAALPVQVSQPSTETQIALGEWGSQVDIKLPPPADVIDASTLKK